MIKERALNFSSERLRVLFLIGVVIYKAFPIIVRSMNQSEKNESYEAVKIRRHTGFNPGIELAIKDFKTTWLFCEEGIRNESDF